MQVKKQKGNFNKFILKSIADYFVCFCMSMRDASMFPSTNSNVNIIFGIIKMFSKFPLAYFQFTQEKMQLN